MSWATGEEHAAKKGAECQRRTRKAWMAQKGNQSGRGEEDISFFMKHKARTPHSEAALGKRCPQKKGRNSNK